MTLFGNFSRCLNFRIQIHFKSRIGNIDFQKKRIQFTLESGISDMVEYDLLIGADGRNSIVRKMLAEVDPSIKFEAKLNGKSWKSFTGLPALGNPLYMINSIFKEISMFCSLSLTV